MNRLTMVLAGLALALAGCQAEEDPFSPGGSPEGSLDILGSPTATAAGSPDASPTGSPDDTDDASPTGSPTGSPDDIGGSGASPTGSPGTGPGTAGADCDEAFADVPDLDQLTGLADFAEALDALDQTIRSCDSVAEWTDQAESILGTSTFGTDVEDFLEARCDDSAELEDTVICQEI